MKTKLDERVYSFITKIPAGKVTTYKLVGNSLRTIAYRAIGQSLRRNPSAPRVPCHRVVCSDGSLGGYCGDMGSKRKIALLKKEGVIVSSGKIFDFEKKLWR